MSGTAAVRVLVSSAENIGSLPQVFNRLDAAINDPFSDLAAIGDILAEDSGLSARLLRIANSAMFNFPGRIETVTRAITVVGTKQLRDLVLATSVISLFKDIAPELVDMESFWRHSIGAGIAARAIATYRRESNIERHYVMGLLHDIGRLLIFIARPAEASASLRRCRDGGMLLYQAEREVLGFDHSSVGDELMRLWRLPESLREPVALHHMPARGGRFAEEAATVHVADVLANALGLGSSGEHSVPPLDLGAWGRLGLPASAIAVLVRQVEKQYEDAVEIFLGGQ